MVGGAPNCPNLWLVASQDIAPRPPSPPALPFHQFWFDEDIASPPGTNPSSPTSSPPPARRHLEFPPPVRHVPKFQRTSHFGHTQRHVSEMCSVFLSRCNATFPLAGASSVRDNALGNVTVVWTTGSPDPFNPVRLPAGIAVNAAVLLVWDCASHGVCEYSGVPPHDGSYVQRWDAPSGCHQLNTQVYFRNHYSEWACTGRPDLRSRTRIRHYSAVPYGTDMHSLISIASSCC